MTYALLNWAHVLVMGYWLGSELVINALTHYVTRATTLPGAERMQLWDFLLDVDQHVRNAMIMSVPLGFSLAALMGLVEIRGAGMWALWIASIAWFAFMWLVHLRRKTPQGLTLARWDWWIRYGLIAFFAASATLSLVTGWPYAADWLALKVLLFAGAMICGIAVRYYIREAYRSALPAIAADRAGAAENAQFRGLMVRATWALVVLWVLLFTIGALGALKPANAAGLSTGASPASDTRAPMTNPLPNDPLEPIADGRDANAGPLSGALVVTRDLAGVRRAYVDGTGLTMQGPLALDARTLAAQRRLWSMPADLRWQVYRLSRPSLPDAIRVLVIVPDRDTPLIRASYDREETGPYALGFPMMDVHAVDARMAALGFKRTLPKVNEYTLQLRDGTPYPIVESSFEIPDNTRLVLLHRGGGLPQNGSTEPGTGLGGPGYSSLIVEDVDAMKAFFTRVLDYEERTSREWTNFRPSFRYVTLHAKGARTGNLGLVEYAPGDRKAGTGIAARPPHRGLAGWSIPVRDLKATLARAGAQRIAVIAEEQAYDDPRFGTVKIATVLAPNGLLVELFERR